MITKCTSSQKTPDADLEVTHTPSMLIIVDTSPDVHATEA
jgi:hypothetical protein